MLTNKLDTPIKRAGFVVMVVGVMLWLIGTIQIIDDAYFSSSSFLYRTKVILNETMRAVTSDSYAYRRHWLAAWGVYLTGAGMLFSFLYDLGLGRIARWIRG